MEGIYWADTRRIKLRARPGLNCRDLSSRRSATRCGTGTDGWPGTTVHARMMRNDLGKKELDPSLGPSPPIQVAGAFFMCHKVTVR